MASKAKVKKEKVKKPVLTRAKDSAREQIDQFLLGLQHSSLAKFSAKLKAADTSDLLTMVGRKVLEQAETIRATIPATAKRPFRAAARVAGPLQAKVKKTTSKKKK